MKKTLTILLALHCAILSFAQQSGNYAPAKANYKANYEEGNYNYNSNNTNAVHPDINKTLPYNRAVPSNDNTINFEINALSNQKADEYVAIFNITQIGKTARETDSLLSIRLNGFLNQLASLGIAKENTFTDMITFLPKYEMDVTRKLFQKKTYTEIPVGFQLQKNVHIRFKDTSILDKMVSAGARFDIYDLVKVDYFISNTDKIYQELRDRTFAYLNDITKSYKKINIALDTVFEITAERRWVAFPLSRYESYQAYSSVSFDAMDGKNANINRAEKNVTQFYHAIPPDGYDIIINPVVAEPVVQYSYSLGVKFTLQPRKNNTAKPEKQYFMVTPNGEVKTLRLD